MSWQALTWACEQKAKATDKLVLIMLANRVNHDTGRCTPAIDRLANECGLSRSGVKVALGRLQQAGLVQVFQRTIDGGNLSNQYELAINGKVTTGPPNDRPPGRGVTTNQESKPGSSPKAAKVDCSSWPSEPSPEQLEGWLALRKRKRAEITPNVMQAMGKALHEAQAMGWTVDDVLAECCLRGWQGLKAEWLTPKEKGLTVRSALHTTPNNRNRDDTGSKQGGHSRPAGGAIDRVLANARERQAQAIGSGAGSDWFDDDGGVRS